jgi:hypothetical protein
MNVQVPGNVPGRDAWRPGPASVSHPIVRFARMQHHGHRHMTLSDDRGRPCASANKPGAWYCPAAAVNGARLWSDIAWAGQTVAHSLLSHEVMRRSCQAVGLVCREMGLGCQAMGMAASPREAIGAGHAARHQGYAGVRGPAGIRELRG